MKEMTSRERVLAALDHTEPDRVPMDLTITLGAYTKLVKHLGLENEVDPEPPVANWLTYVPVDIKVLKELDIDIVHVGCRPPSGFPKHLPGGGFIDEWGIKRVPIERPDGGFYLEFDGNPLSDATIEDLEDYSWPDPHDPAVTEGLLEDVKWWRENTDFAIQAWLERGNWGETAGYLRGIERWWEDLIVNQEFAWTLMNKIADIAMEFNRLCIDVVGEYVDIIRFTGWDLGGQNGLLFSPKTFNGLFKPLR